MSIIIDGTGTILGVSATGLTTAQTVTQIANQSFDQAYQVSVTEALTLNPISL